MRSENLLRTRGKKLWIIIGSDKKDEKELELQELVHNRLLFIPKPYDLDIIKMTVDQVSEWKAEEERAPKNTFRRLLARFLGKEA